MLWIYKPPEISGRETQGECKLYIYFVEIHVTNIPDLSCKVQVLFHYSTWTGSLMSPPHAENIIIETYNYMSQHLDKIYQPQTHFIIDNWVSHKVVEQNLFCTIVESRHHKSTFYKCGRKSQSSQSCGFGSEENHSYFILSLSEFLEISFMLIRNSKWSWLFRLLLDQSICCANLQMLL